MLVRPTELDAKTEARILEATRKGLSRRVVAGLAGISSTTLFKWIKKGRAGQEPYASFVHRLKEAETGGEETLIDLLRAHAIETWQAAAWLLERRYPDRYSLTQRVKHEVQFTEEQARAKYRELTGKDWGQ